MLRIMDFWLRTPHLDVLEPGFRLDAVQYPDPERPGAASRPAPRTRRWSSVAARCWATNTRIVLLAGANQWPGDVRDYFGDGLDSSAR